MTARLRSLRWVVATLATAVLVAGCGSTAGDDSADTGGGSERRALLSSVAEDESVGLDDVDTADIAEGSGQLAAADEVAPTGPFYPLTGLAIRPDDGEAERRPALVVKIDNHPRARPQTGLDQADIVFDMRAEGVTRFAAVYQSFVPDPVGPVRSSRTSDFDILLGFDRPLYASSGGNDYVAGKLRTLPIVELTNLTRTEYFRDFSRPAPHNLYVNASDLYLLAPGDPTAPTPWFAYRGPDDDLGLDAVSIEGPVTIDFTGSPTVTYTWDESRLGWLRTQDNNPHTTAGGDQLAPENVVIMITDYGVSPADPISPEVRSTGSGPLVVLSAGQAVTGRWERQNAEDTPTLFDNNEHAIALSPGRTWVLLPESGQVTFPAGSVLDDWAG